jgi:hypothetical protein
MAKLTSSDVARACRVARRPRQRAVQAGRRSLDTDLRVDTAELLRAGDTRPAARPGAACRTRQAALQDAAPRSSSTRQDAAALAPSDVTLMQPTMAARERDNALRRAALDAAAAREEEARVQTQAAREERALLLQRLQDMQHRYDPLLDMPRSAPPPPGPRAPALRSSATPGDTRGDMRRRIVALLQEHPEGLTPGEMRTLLGVDKSLTDTCLGMLRYGLLRRVERGRYVVA